MPRADLVVADGTNLAHRVWHASGARPYEASITLTSMIRSAISLHAPVWAAVAFDAPSCWRHRRYPAYKANRPDKDPALIEWIEGLRGLDRIAGARVVTAPDHEADDVLASLTWQAICSAVPGKDPPTVMLVTGDHDAWSMIGTRVAVALLSTGSGARYVNADEVERKLGIPPSLILPYKALVGDPSDNVKGVPGIGPVRGRALLQESRGLKGRTALLDALSRLTRPPCRCHLDEAKALAMASYDIVRPVFTAPVTRQLRELGVVA